MDSRICQTSTATPAKPGDLLDALGAFLKSRGGSKPKIESTGLLAYTLGRSGRSKVKFQIQTRRERNLSRSGTLSKYQSRGWALGSILSAFLIAAGVASGIGRNSPEEKVRNPFANDSEAINQGRSLFRQGCSPCHGANAKRRGPGPDLTLGLWEHGGSDAELFRTTKLGVPGTAMPPTRFRDDEIWMILAFLRTLGQSSRAPVAGDREEGRRIFHLKANCSQCHMIEGKGGSFGPEISRIGKSRSPEHLAESIRNPNKEILERYEAVNVVMKDGKRITGVRMNEDTFSIQFMAPDEALHLYWKKDIREITYDRESLMPAYGQGELNEKDLQDLIAYLESLRGK